MKVNYFIFVKIKIYTNVHVYVRMYGKYNMRVRL